MSAPTSPYAVDWNFGVMPTAGTAVDAAPRPASRAVAVIIPGTFIGLLREHREEDGRCL